MGGAPSYDPPVNPYEVQLGKIAKAYWKETAPLRAQVFPQLSQFATGGYKPQQLPAFRDMYNLARTGTESQYNVARENVMGQTPRGGALTHALSDVESARAGQVGALPAQISTQLVPNLWGQTFGAAVGSPGATTGALGPAAASFNQSQATAASQSLAGQQMANQMWGGLGGGIGAIAASLLMAMAMAA